MLGRALLLSVGAASVCSAYTTASHSHPRTGGAVVSHCGSAPCVRVIKLDREGQLQQRYPEPRAFFERALDEPESDTPPGPFRDTPDGDANAPGYRGPAEDAQGYWAPLAYSPDRLRAGDLNEMFHPDYMQRAKFSVSPMQAYGALFKSETVLDGMLELNRESWTMVANEHDYEPPDDEQVLRAMGVRPERAIQSIFRWTDDWGDTKRLAFERWEAHTKIFQQFDFQPAPGAINWLSVLGEYKVPCVVATKLAREEADAVLEKAGLRDLFQHVVTADDGCETAEQEYLVSCLKIERPPSRCVVFENEPQGVVSAHDAMTKVVAVIGQHPGYAFQHADMRIGSLEELSLMSLREVFRDEDPR